MKTLARVVVVGLLGGVCLGWLLSAPADLQGSASVQVRARADFDVPLSAHGSWAEIQSYGRCWRPTSIAAGWRPYCDGRWVWTDCGWYWESDEPWAWACYHYGRWVHDPTMGWFWVPDIEWAPAWVYWRVGGGFIGWAPCPPRGVVIAPLFFNFVAVERFHERIHPASVVVNNATIISQTKEITEVKRANRTIGGVRQKVVINEGPGVSVVQKAVGKKIPATPIQDVAWRVPPTRSEPHEEVQPAEKARKSAVPDPSDGNPKSPARPKQPEDTPSKNQPARPAGTFKEEESPGGEPRQPHSGTERKSDFDWGKGQGRGKGKP